MILYKYLSAKSASRVLMENKLWFSIASMLNDPFETKAGMGHPNFDKILGDFSRNQVIEQNYKILCLTRDPLSSIMWSHYADEHRGMVIGIDTKVAGLEDEATCVLPAQYGSIIYTRTRPNFSYGEKSDLPPGYAQSSNYNHKLLQFLQRNFLYKSSEWHYEEEVRIVKSTKSLTGNVDFPHQDYEWPNFPNGAPFLVPNDSIKEIYLGTRFYNYSENEMADILRYLISSAPHARIYDAYPDAESWYMKAREIVDWREHLQDLFYPT